MYAIRVHKVRVKGMRVAISEGRLGILAVIHKPGCEWGFQLGCGRPGHMSHEQTLAQSRFETPFAQEEGQHNLPVSYLR